MNKTTLKSTAQKALSAAKFIEILEFNSLTDENAALKKLITAIQKHQKVIILE